MQSEVPAGQQVKAARQEDMGVADTSSPDARPSAGRAAILMYSQTCASRVYSQIAAVLSRRTTAWYTTLIPDQVPVAVRIRRQQLPIIGSHGPCGKCRGACNQG